MAILASQLSPLTRSPTAVLKPAQVFKCRRWVIVRGCANASQSMCAYYSSYFHQWPLVLLLALSVAGKVTLTVKIYEAGHRGSLEELYKARFGIYPFCAYAVTFRRKNLTSDCSPFFGIAPSELVHRFHS